MGKVVIVTGASRGIGKAIATLVLDKDKSSRVVLCARSSAQLDEFVSHYPDRTLAVAGDLTDKATAKAVVDQTVSKFGQIDAVVFNAGRIDPIGHIADVSNDDLKRIFDLNFFSIVELLRQTIPHLRKSGKNTPASCLFVSTGASDKHFDGLMAYGSSKAAVEHVNLDLSVEEAPYIRSMAIAPGVVDTSMNTFIRENAAGDLQPEAYQSYVDMYTQGKMLRPEYPASLYANLVLQGIPDELNGKSARYSDDIVSQYIDSPSAA